jgi:hypothetical protein
VALGDKAQLPLGLGQGDVEHALALPDALQQELERDGSSCPCQGGLRRGRDGLRRCRRPGCRQARTAGGDAGESSSRSSSVSISAIASLRPVLLPPTYVGRTAAPWHHGDAGLCSRQLKLANNKPILTENPPSIRKVVALSFSSVTSLALAEHARMGQEPVRSASSLQMRDLYRDVGEPLTHSAKTLAFDREGRSLSTGAAANSGHPEPAMSEC